MKSRWLLGIALFFATTLVHASIVVTMYLTNAEGQGMKIGTIKADDTIWGLLLKPHLKGLPPGVHGFHLHALPECGNYGRAAGGHYDPERNDRHMGPYVGTGHLGDMPVLIVDPKGRATLPVLAPRLTLSAIKDKTFVIDAGDDNYSDSPQMNGGGGAHIACGPIGFF